MTCDSCGRDMGLVGTFQEAGVRKAAYECGPCHRGIVIDAQGNRSKMGWVLRGPSLPSRAR